MTTSQITEKETESLLDLIAKASEWLEQKQEAQLTVSYVVCHVNEITAIDHSLANAATDLHTV